MGNQLDLFPVPRDWYARPLPYYAARGGHAPVDIGTPPPWDPALSHAPDAPAPKQAVVLGVVTHEEVEALRAQR